MIKKIDENNNETIYTNLQEAQKSIDSKMENWKIQLLIADAINTHKKAFKCKWENI